MLDPALIQAVPLVLLFGAASVTAYTIGHRRGHLTAWEEINRRLDAERAHRVEATAEQADREQESDAWAADRSQLWGSVAYNAEVARANAQAPEPPVLDRVAAERDYAAWRARKGLD